MQQHASTYSVTKTLIHPQPLGGVKGLYNFFWKESLVMLHIKLEGNGAKSTMLAHILVFDTSSTPGVVSKV